MAVQTSRERIGEINSQRGLRLGIRTSGVSRKVIGIGVYGEFFGIEDFGTKCVFAMTDICELEPI